MNKVPLAAAFLQNGGNKSGGRPSNTKVQQQLYRPSKSVQTELARANYRDFTMCTTIGTGAFGCVKLCRHRVNGETCAMKITHKNFCATAAKDGKKYESPAIDLITKLDAPFVIRTYRTFWEGDEVCTLMEVGDGGEFSEQIKRGGMEPETARFYAAEMALAIAAVHDVGIAFHDFKPNNLLLTATGHIKLIDFGLASTKVGNKRKGWCKCCCGTPCYMAPELITAQPHDTAVDWWSLGCVIYEMLCGSRPFDSGNKSTLIKQICQGKPDYPSRHFPADSRRLCESLMRLDEGARMCCTRGVKELKKHSWFDGLNWEALEKGALEPPIQPGVVIDAGGGFSGAMFAAAGGRTQEVNSSWFNGQPGTQNASSTSPSKKKSSRVAPEADFRCKHS